jgi:hypothetical protein
MSAIDQISEHFIYAEKLRRLRRQLMETIDHSRREQILRQIEEIEEELKTNERRKFNLIRKALGGGAEFLAHTIKSSQLISSWPPRSNHGLFSAPQ